MNGFASFFKGCRFKSTIVDGYSVVLLYTKVLCRQSGQNVVDSRGAAENFYFESVTEIVTQERASVV